MKKQRQNKNFDEPALLFQISAAIVSNYPTEPFITMVLFGDYSNPYADTDH